MNFLPINFAYAQSGKATDFKSLVQLLISLLNILIPLIIGVALVVFLYGIVRYVLGSGDDKSSAKSIMLWGIIALFVMVSVWGLVGILQSTFFGGTLGIPQLK